MVITQNLLVKLLNMDLELKYSAAIQYINHASLLNQITPYRCIGKEVTLDAIEEAQHAVLLAAQIARLGGSPSVHVGRIFVCQDVREMLLRDMGDAQDAVTRCQNRIEQAEQLKEYDLAQQLRYVLEMEQEHVMDFRHYRSMRQRERMLPVVDMVEQDQFSEKWQERALHVPVRTKVR